MQMALTELREYLIQKDKTQEWLKYMEKEVLPYQISKGMRVLSTYVYTDEDDQDWFIWLREFDDEIHRQQVYQNTYDTHWIENFRPKIFQLIDKDNIKVRLLSEVKIK